MSQQMKHVKDQFNKPRYSDGTLMPILKCSSKKYSLDDLKDRAYLLGYKDAIQTPKYDLYDPYWVPYTSKSDILISKAGEVACRFDDLKNGSGYKIMAQEWKQEYSPETFDLLNELKEKVRILDTEESLLNTVSKLTEIEQSKQKYLWVYLRNNPEFPLSGSLHQLHRLVADTHCLLTEEIVEWITPESLKFRGALQTEHLDCRKDNNSVHNLRFTTNYINQRAIRMECEEKIDLYANMTPIGYIREFSYASH